MSRPAERRGVGPSAKHKAQLGREMLLPLVVGCQASVLRGEARFFGKVAGMAIVAVGGMRSTVDT